MKNSQVVVQLSKVEKTFTEQCVLSDVSFALPKGKVTAVCGLNACGKTTLLKIIAGVLPPDAGSVIYASEQINIGYIPQDSTVALMPWYKAFRNVMIASNGTISRKEAIEFLADFGLDKKKASQYPLQLSGGYQQRLAWACATCGTKDILILDEPFANQDRKGTELLVSKILNIRKKQHASTIFAVHDLEEAVICADQILILDECVNGCSSLISVEEISLDDSLRMMNNVANFSVRKYVEKIASIIYSEKH